MTPIGDFAAPPATEPRAGTVPVNTGTAPVTAAPAPTRKRRAYQVWELGAVPNADAGRERWSIIANDVDATSRSVAIEQTTGGRPGTFATVLVGEWVEETVDDPQGELVQAVTSAVAAFVTHDVKASQIDEAVRKAIAGVGSAA